MVLKVIDMVKGETSLVSIKVIEKHNDDRFFYIWDTSGDSATITVAVPSDVQKVLNELYTTGKATVPGSMEWEEV